VDAPRPRPADGANRSRSRHFKIRDFVPLVSRCQTSRKTPPLPSSESTPLPGKGGANGKARPLGRLPVGQAEPGGGADATKDVVRESWRAWREGRRQAHRRASCRGSQDGEGVAAAAGWRARPPGPRGGRSTRSRRSWRNGPRGRLNGRPAPASCTAWARRRYCKCGLPAAAARGAPVGDDGQVRFETARARSPGGLGRLRLWIADTRWSACSSSSPRLLARLWARAYPHERLDVVSTATSAAFRCFDGVPLTCLLTTIPHARPRPPAGTPRALASPCSRTSPATTATRPGLQPYRARTKGTSSPA